MLRCHCRSWLVRALHCLQNFYSLYTCSSDHKQCRARSTRNISSNTPSFCSCIRGDVLSAIKDSILTGVNKVFPTYVSYHWHYFYFRLKCLGISFYCLLNSLLNHVLVALRIETTLAVTSTAEHSVRETLAVPRCGFDIRSFMLYGHRYQYLQF